MSDGLDEFLLAAGLGNAADDVGEQCVVAGFFSIPQFAFDAAEAH